MPAEEIAQVCDLPLGSRRTLQRDLAHLEALQVTQRTGNARRTRWSFTDEVHDYFQEMKIRANREHYDLHRDPDIVGVPRWRHPHWGHWRHARTRERLNPILEEMIRHLMFGAWAAEQVRLQETREAAIDRFMRQANATVREEVRRAAVARARRELGEGAWRAHDDEWEPKDNGKFG